MRQSPALMAALAVSILSAAVLTWLAQRWSPQLAAFAPDELSAAARIARLAWPVVWVIPAGMLVAALLRPTAASRRPWPERAGFAAVALSLALGVALYIPLFKLAAAR